MLLKLSTNKLAVAVAATAALVFAIAATDTAQTSGIAVGNVSSFGAPCVVDLNADGFTDLIIDRHKSAKWDVYAGKADGTFAPMANAPGRKVDTHGCVVDDFNQDGKLDVVGIKGACQGTCLKTDDLWIADGNGWELRNWHLGPVSYDRNRAAASADLNGDGWPELITVAAGSPTNSQHRIYWNNGGSPWQGFTQQAISKASGDTSCIQVADINTDGALDVLACTADGLAASLGPRYGPLAPLGVGLVESLKPAPGGWLVVRPDRLELTGQDFSPLESWPLVYGRDAALIGADCLVVVQATAGQPATSLAAHFSLRREGGVWSRGDLPQPPRGAGAHVADVNGRALVLNGGKSAVTGLWDRKGPRQLLADPCSLAATGD